MDIKTTLLDAIAAHGNDVDVYDDETGCGMAWVLDGERDVIVEVLERIASETALVSDNALDVDADLWGWCEANLAVMEAFGREWNHGRAQIDGTDEGLCHAVSTVQQLANGGYCEDAYRWLADRLGAA